MGSEMKVEELSLAHIKSAQEDFNRAVAETMRVIEDIDHDRLQPGAKVELTLKITFEPTSKLDGVDITCQGSLKLPKYPADSVHALNRLGKLKVVEVDQGELPGIRGARVVSLREEI